MVRLIIPGWWVCCRCCQPNSPALAVDTCATCGHRECPCCPPYYGGNLDRGADRGPDRSWNPTRSSRPTTRRLPAAPLFSTNDGSSSRLQSPPATTLARYAAVMPPPLDPSETSLPPPVSEEIPVKGDDILVRILCEDEVITACFNRGASPGYIPGLLKDSVADRLAELLDQCRYRLLEDPLLDKHKRLTIERHMPYGAGEVADKVKSELMNKFRSGLGRRGVRRLNEQATRDDPEHKRKGLVSLPEVERLRQILLSTEAYRLLRHDLLDSTFPTLYERMRSWYNEKIPLTEDNSAVTPYVNDMVLSEFRCIRPEKISFNLNPPNGWLNLCKGAVEKWTRTKRDWWPLKAHVTSLNVDESWVSWPCQVWTLTLRILQVLHLMPVG
ncbi:uncharacterized protein BDV17DRAFT_105287 [Aspergillus undulatus]|uniref:uncharacterized protein n=1 Tax=Aspergillus undulatus TaxID=1810928 RepID=UPI003CCE263E